MRGTLRAWIASGQLPHFRLGAKGRRGKIAIDAEDLAAVISTFRVVAKKESGRVSAPAPKSAFKHLKFG